MDIQDVFYSLPNGFEQNKFRESLYRLLQGNKQPITRQTLWNWINRRCTPQRAEDRDIILKNLSSYESVCAMFQTDKSADYTALQNLYRNDTFTLKPVPDKSRRFKHYTRN